MENGVVKFFNQTKGFGFIKMNGSDKEVFVHVTGLKLSLIHISEPTRPY